MHIIDGKKIARQIEEDIKKRIGEKKPCLATILIGDNESSKVYMGVKEKACQRLGINSVQVNFPETVTENEVAQKIVSYNKDENIHGILLQLPLPTHFDQQRLIETIDPRKDVDGLHPKNMGAILLKREYLVPCTPSAILKILEHEHVSVSGQDVVIVNHSPVVGKPLAMMLLNRDATVTICHVFTRNLKKHTSRADILVTGTGVAALITQDFVKTGALVIDVGICRGVDGKIQGDVDFLSVQTKAGGVTPVPGGVGPVTVACLLENTFTAFTKMTSNH